MGDLILCELYNRPISAKQLQQHLGCSYQTAWHMCHRIREAMQDSLGSQLSGTVEVDETWIGGKVKRRGGRVRNQKPRAEKFDMVIGLRERSRKPNAEGYGKIGRVKFVHIPDGKASTIKAVIDQHVNPSVQKIYTDGAAIYDFSLHESFKRKHRTVNHSMQWVVPGGRDATSTKQGT